MVDLDALEAAAKAATQGEWRAEQRTLKHVVVFGNHRRPALSIVYGDSGDNIPNYGTEPEAHANAAYIVAAQPRVVLDLIAELRAVRGALEQIAVYGCGMLNQPATVNGPEEAWLRRRIDQYERTARAALAGDRHD